MYRFIVIYVWAIACFATQKITTCILLLPTLFLRPHSFKRIPELPQIQPFFLKIMNLAT